jgi:hypothetical protein
MRALAPFALTLALSFVGSAVERDEDWSPPQMDGYWILEGDIHAHSILAGALPTPIDLVLLARHQKLDFLAVGEHNSLFGAKLADIFARWFYPEVIVLPSEEVTTRRYHVHAIGIRDAIDASLPLREVAAEAHRQGALVVAAHPVRRFWGAFEPLARAGALDGIEVMHPIRVVPRPGSVWRGQDLVEFWERASQLSGRTLSAVGGSDYHGLAALGLCRTVVLARDRTAAGILEAIREGRTAAVGPDGKLEGNPQWVSFIERAGYRVRPSRHSYAEASTGAQALGWVVLLVLVTALFWRRISPA